MKKEHWLECSYSDFKEIVEESTFLETEEKILLIRQQLSYNQKFHKEGFQTDVIKMALSANRIAT